jgi:hypothetical protein
MNKEELRETRKQMFAQMEQRLQEMHPKEEDSLFYYHSSEDRIVLSHALFWVMTQPQCLKGRLGSGDGSLIRCLLAPLMWRNPVQSYS